MSISEIQGVVGERARAREEEEEEEVVVMVVVVVVVVEEEQQQQKDFFTFCPWGASEQASRSLSGVHVCLC
jgi:hypothetical protein